jgi:uncharacterized membrane protein (UPF0127 family)
MRWHKKTVRAVNRTRGTVVGESIRVADSPLTGIVGLLGERDLSPGDGLLIVPCQGVHTLGMLFSIDIVVLDGDWNVMEVRRDLRPYRLTRMFWKAAAVLELRSGAVEASWTRAGDAFEFSFSKEHL